MNDQAETLRELMQGREEDGGAGPARVWVAGSARGGIGRSSLLAALGRLSARRGLRVLLVDADGGPAAGSERVVSGSASLLDAIAEVEPGLWCVAGAALTKAGINAILSRCPLIFDLVLVDGPSGAGEAALALHGGSWHSLVVMTAEASALADTYGLVKGLRQRAGVSRVAVTVNLVTDGREAVTTYQKLKNVADRFLGSCVDYAGHWERERDRRESVMKQKFLLNLESGTASGRSLELIARRLRELCGLGGAGATVADSVQGSPRLMEEPVRKMPGNIAGFWRNLLGEVKT